MAPVCPGGDTLVSPPGVATGAGAAWLGSDAGS